MEEFVLTANLKQDEIWHEQVWVYHQMKNSCQQLLEGDITLKEIFWVRETIPI